ncbi:MAG: hypothetical protein ACR2QC_10490 [Gammaproteobacteria bacterium]
MTETKQCAICGVYFPSAEFDFGRGRIRAECKRCVNKLGQIRRNRGLQKMREWRNQTVREWNPAKRKKKKKKGQKTAADISATARAPDDSPAAFPEKE